MAGYGLDGYAGRVPCPHCGSTDCCGIKGSGEDGYLICCKTDKRVSATQLEQSAKDHDMSRYKASNYKGWEIHTYFYVGESDQTHGRLHIGAADIHSLAWKYRGTLHSVEAAKKFIDLYGGNQMSYAGSYRKCKNCGHITYDYASSHINMHNITGEQMQLPCPDCSKT